MELFTQLFGNLLAFVYHCFDRIVIYGYLSGLSRPEQVVHFFRQVVGVPVVDKEVLRQRTADYQAWVDAFARNHRLPIEWAEKGVRKEDHGLPWQRRMARDDAYGVYFIFKSMEQGPSFRISVPKYATKDPNYRILARQRSRFTHYYFYLRDETLGPMVMRVASFFPFQTTYYLNGHSFIEQELKRAQIGFRKTDNAFLAVDDVAALQAAADKLSPQIIRTRLDYWTLILGPKFSTKERKQLNLSRFYAIAQIEYCRNFIFKRNFPIHKLFERSCELGLWRLTGDKSPTNSPTSASKRDWTISMPSASVSKPSPTALPASRRNGSMSTSTFHCCSASLCRSPSARCAIPGSRSTIRALSACSNSSSMAAVMSAAGPPNKSTTPSSPPSTSPTAPTASTNCATICAS